MCGANIVSIDSEHDTTSVAIAKTFQSFDRIEMHWLGIMRVVARTIKIGYNSSAEDSATVILDQFFGDRAESRLIFEALYGTIAALGSTDLRVTKSQVAFRRRIAFAWAWMPDVYLGPGHAPLVLTVAFRRRDPSSRWKQVVEPAPGRFIHHLELYSAEAIDEQVRAWLAEAWQAAG